MYFYIIDRFFSAGALIALGLVMAVYAPPAFSEDRIFQPRVETNFRFGTERSIIATEAWIPLAQEQNRVIYADARLMGDDDDSREWNLGLGYRSVNDDRNAVLGLHGWLDRRRTSRGSIFHQATGGFEYLGDSVDIRLNGYLPFNEQENYLVGDSYASPYLADTGIYYNVPGRLVEKPLHGADIELAVPVPVLESAFEDFRISAGGFAFDGNNVESLRGLRLRAVANINADIQIGTRFETDNKRGAQGFAELTLRFPFGAKTSAKTLGLRSRLDESPVRDVDIITSAEVTIAPITHNMVKSALDGLAQRVFHVDNTAAPGGNGSLGSPFNTLAAAQAAANRAGDIIYINRGDGTTTGMNQGLTISHGNQAVIGSGADFLYDNKKFTNASGQNFSGAVLRAASAPPVITNNAGYGVTVTAPDIELSGFNISGTSADGVYARAQNSNYGTLTISSMNVSNNGGAGLYISAVGAGGNIGTHINNVTTNNNADGGIFISPLFGGHVGNVYISGSTANNNGSDGITVAGISGNTDKVTIIDSKAVGNTASGLYLAGFLGSSMPVTLQRVTSTNNSDSGVYILSTSAVDLGGGSFGSIGENRIFNNTTEDLYVDLSGGTLKAENNWWGSAAGLLPAQLTLQGGSSVDATPWLVSDPAP